MSVSSEKVVGSKAEPEEEEARTAMGGAGGPRSDALAGRQRLMEGDLDGTGILCKARPREARGENSSKRKMR